MRLLMNTRKTECGARQLLTRLVVRAAPFALLGWLFLSALAFAQEGHPVVGTWHGNWGTSAASRTDVTLVMFWDGKAITGMLNPGPDSVKLENATLDAEGWKLHFEGTAKDRTGKTVRVVVDGKLENITNVRRTLSGTWKQGDVAADFKFVRDN